MNYNEVRTLLVSPHQDDIALSLGGAVLSGHFARPIVVLNVFTTTIYAPFYEGPHDAISVSKVRALEDDAFAKRLGLIHLDLGLRDALLRWNLHQDVYPLLAASSFIRGWPAPNSRLTRKLSRLLTKLPTSLKESFLQEAVRFDWTYHVVKSRILELVSKCRKATVVSPLSLAPHPDHMIVSRACRDIKPWTPGVVFYEDLPYASKYKMREILRHANHFDASLSPRLVDISSVLEEKVRNLGEYRSQLGKTEIEAVVQHSKRIGQSSAFERLWISGAE